VRKAKELEQVLDAGAQRAPWDAFERADVFEKLNRREMRIDAEVLRQIPERATQRVGRLRDVASVESDRSAAGLRDRGEHTHQRRLPGAVGAEQPENAGLEPQREIVDGVHAAVALVQGIDLEFHRRIYGIGSELVSRIEPLRSAWIDGDAVCAGCSTLSIFE
jgi:hypothetical protein